MTMKQRGKDKHSWSIWVELPKNPVTGERRKKMITFKGTKKEAEKKERELRAEIDKGSYVNPEKGNLADYLTTWIKDYAWPNLAPKTAQNYESMITKHLAPGLGHIAMGQLRPEHIEHYLSEKRASGLSAKTVRHHYVTLHTALGHAVKHELLGRNPCDNVTPPRPQQTEMRVLDDIGVWKVLDAAKQTEYYSLFYFFLYTGCRRSEVLALRWQDLDLTRSQAFITRSLHQLRDGSIVYRQPKTARSRRMIVLPPSLTLVLKDHRETQEAIKETLGLNLSDQDLVFCHVEGSPYLPDTITHVWLKLTRKVGLQGIRLHDARHTHATLMLRQGVHPKIVQERLGHASIQHTLDVYSHVTDGLQAAAALKFDQVLEVRQELERQAAT